MFTHDSPTPHYPSWAIVRADAITRRATVPLFAFGYRRYLQRLPFVSVSSSTLPSPHLSSFLFFSPYLNPSYPSLDSSMPLTPSEAAKALESFTFSESKTAVIIGSTTGIGAGIARLLAKLGCQRVLIFGRNGARAAVMLEDLRKLANEHGHQIVVEYVKGDLSTVAGMRTSVLAIEESVGLVGIDYLIMCQNGVPTGTLVENSDGLEQAFVVQTVSRFAVAYLLTTHGFLAPNASCLSVANVGQSLDDLDVDDLSLRAAFESGKRYKVGLFMDQSKRDSSVLDAFHAELNTRFPQYNYYHVWPGLVRGENFSLSKFPFPLNCLVWMGLQLIGSTPEIFANVPVYILLKPEGEKKIEPSQYWSYTLKPMQPGKWATQSENREAVWLKLKAIIGEEQ